MFKMFVTIVCTAILACVIMYKIGEALLGQNNVYKLSKRLAEKYQ